MPRKRLLSPQFFTNADLFRAERATGLPLRLAFEGLWCQADRRGYFAWKPEELKLAILPYDQVDMTDTMLALCRFGFLKVFEVEGRLYGVIPNFPKWQTFNIREKPDAHIPEPLTPSDVTDTVPARYRNGTDTPGTGTGTGTGTNNKLLPPARKKREPRPVGQGSPTWITPAATAWEAVYGAGSFDIGQATGELKHLYRKGAGLTPDQIGERLRFYLKCKGIEGSPTREQLERANFRPSLRDFRLRHGAFDPHAPAEAA